ncbi:hypothetical protein [Shewanella sp. NIFS-20-20]|uniref:hypothetical protein n=1 Tax=Shewanella sp. NIFS-20-20 TaxID=2853806 RepID=UPI001C448983|nr:hypothetical protein [Shewanella sp. NIFS-20-20]MBV7317028.1 hypothetical protein [Shewanella sp. NIFS-20-20]
MMNPRDCLNRCSATHGLSLLTGLWLLLLPMSVAAELESQNRLDPQVCHHYAPSAAQPSLTVNDITQAQAQAALVLLQQSIVGEQIPNTHWQQDQRQLLMIDAYLAKKALLYAIKNHQHDGDEIIAFCTLWQQLAFK